MPARGSIASLALLLLLTACDTADPTALPAPAVTLQVEGALQRTFEGAAVQSQALAAVQERPAGNELLLLLEAETRGDGGAERALLQVELPLAFEGGLPAPGDYTFALESGGRAHFTYALDRQEELRARYQFEGSDVGLRIERVDANLVTGRLSLRAEQVHGIRTLHGQTEEVALNGPVYVSAVFEAEVQE